MISPFIKWNDWNSLPGFFAAFCGEKVGHGWMAKMDRAMSMAIAEQQLYKKLTHGIRVINVYTVFMCTFTRLSSHNKQVKRLCWVGHCTLVVLHYNLVLMFWQLLVVLVTTFGSQHL